MTSTGSSIDAPDGLLQADAISPPDTLSAALSPFWRLLSGHAQEADTSATGKINTTMPRKNFTGLGYL